MKNISQNLAFSLKKTAKHLYKQENMITTKRYILVNQYRKTEIDRL